MSVRSHALRVLHSHAAHRVQFQYTGLGSVTITVGSQTFERVAHAIEANTVRLDGPAGLPAGTDGAYFDGNFTDPAGHRFSGRFCLTTNTGSRIWDAVFIHEAVHASFDLTGSTLSMADNEAAAYVASAMYCHLVGLPLSRWRSQMPNELRVRATARQALRTATITSMKETAALRDVMIWSGYNGTPSNPNPMGTIANPLFYSGSY